jgi:hypothetical protein
VNEANQTEVCPQCAETIKRAALVCPHCRMWQKKWSLRNPNVVLALGSVVWMGFLVGVTYFLEQMMGAGRDFAGHRDELRVVASSYSFSDAKDGPRLVLVGTVTNSGGWSWKEIQIEARFFDAAGHLIDTKVGHDLGTLLPAAEGAFRVEVKPARPAAEYASHSATVRAARDARRMF